jgi:hypothetical protein
MESRAAFIFVGAEKEPTNKATRLAQTFSLYSMVVVSHKIATKYFIQQQASNTHTTGYQVLDTRYLKSIPVQITYYTLLPLKSCSSRGREPAGCYHD